MMIGTELRARSSLQTSKPSTRRILGASADIASSLTHEIVGWSGHLGPGIVIEPRIYRAAFVPALLAAIVAMFALESQPRPLPQAAPADVLFEATSAANTTRGIVERTPDRTVGTPGDEAAA